jgi:hypothetical protein
MVDRLANYEPVQARIQRFYNDHPRGRIIPTIGDHDDKRCEAWAEVWFDITDLVPTARGHAVEVHDGSPVNRQGWMLENAETSAVGRALAFAGYAPNHIPTAEDMQRVEGRTRQQIAEQKTAEAHRDMAVHVFKRLKDIAGTPLATDLKATAQALDHALTVDYLTANPAWCQTVDEAITAETGNTV